MSERAVFDQLLQHVYCSHSLALPIIQVIKPSYC